jgi:hypothetical protein
LGVFSLLTADGHAEKNFFCIFYIFSERDVHGFYIKLLP